MKAMLFFISCLLSAPAFSQLYAGEVNLTEAQELDHIIVTCKTQSYSFNDVLTGSCSYGVDLGGIESKKRLKSYFTDSTGKKVVHLSSVNAVINYVHKNGWELAQMTTNTLADPKETERINSYYYLVFKRRK
jgi:hypothetical protein